MAIYRLDKDFLNFLDSLNPVQDPWILYKSHYFIPNLSFLATYWRTFRWFDEDQIRQRVKEIKKEHYGHLRTLIEREDLESVTLKTFRYCRMILPMARMPDVYYFIGFFSSDAFTINLRGNWAIGIGCERFQDFGSLPIFLAHEYGHCFLNARGMEHIKKGLDPLIESLFSEGIAVHLSAEVFPTVPLERHTFLSRSTYRWCLEHRSEHWSWLRTQIGAPGGISKVFSSGEHEKGIPFRTGYFLAYQWVEALRRKMGKEKDLCGFIEELINTGSLVKRLKLYDHRLVP